MIKKFVQGIKNIIIFLPVVWKFRAWDYAYTLRILATCLEQIRIEPYVIQTKKEERSIGAAIFLCNRMSDQTIDNIYGIEESKLKSKKEVLFHPREQNDLKQLTEILNKRLLSWWS